jgi:hypothetical protein
MQEMATKTASAAGELKDGRLFREACYLDGQWILANSGQTIDVDNPATGEIIGRVPKLDATETRQAIEAASRAFPAWSMKTAKERAAVLRRWFDLMMENQEDLARLMTLEQGKPLAESNGEVAYAAAFLEWFGEEAKRVYGDTIPQHQADKRIVVVKQPIGVVACITPWNFPLAMRRLHGSVEARFADAFFGARARRAGGTCWSAEGCIQCADGSSNGNWRGTDFESDCTQAFVHRFHRNWKDPDVSVCWHSKKAFSRAGRECAVHRF